MTHRPGTKWTDEDFESVIVPAVRRSVSIKAAARELGMSGSHIPARFIARGLNIEDYIGRSTVPDGHRVKGNSTYEQDGKPPSRWIKTEQDSSDNDARVPVVPPAFAITDVSSNIDGQGNVRQQWISSSQAEGDRWNAFLAACETHAAKYKGLAKAAKAPKAADEQLLSVFPLGDPHIGMLSYGRETGDDFDLKIAERDLISTVDLLAERAPSSGEALLANLGDYLHAETAEQRTPRSGVKLDCDTRWTRIYDIGLRVMRRLIDRLLAKHARVVVANIPGNHDPHTAHQLACWLRAVYENEPRVEVLDANPYIYRRFGKNLIGITHGHGPPMAALPGLMATDRRVDWGETEFSWWLTGHVHHERTLKLKEYPTCIVESFRTLAGKDAWHYEQGYRSGQSLSCVTLHENWGEITRSTVGVKLARDAA
jgi:hypothetical protein